MSQRLLFGTDGIRGIANGDVMNSDLMLKLGRALGLLIQQSKRKHQVVIGKDTRISGYMLETALASGLCSVGVDVWLCGPLPTPGVAFLTSSMRADAGVVISASHNPYQDNGVKIFSSDGFKLPDEKELALEHLISLSTPSLKTASMVGRAHRIDDAVGRYVAYLKTILPKELDLCDFKIAIDAAHGAGYRVAPMVFSELGAQVITHAVDPNGENINEQCGALHPQHLQSLVKQTHCDIGLALDGDADRLIVIDDQGDILDGDALLAILARDLKAKNQLKGDCVVATMMSNLGLELSLAQAHINLMRTQVGDRYVLEKLRMHGLNLGGEQSGHMICLNYGTTGDAIMAALMLLTAIKHAGQPLSYLKRCISIFPQCIVNVAVQKKIPLEELVHVKKLIQEVESNLKHKGRVLVRYSGTEPKARVMVEGENEQQVKKYAHDIATEIQNTLMS